MDLKSKHCPVGEFSTSSSGRLLPTSPALYYPKETSSGSVFRGPGESSASGG